jgi:hypothetical protein
MKSIEKLQKLGILRRKIMRNDSGIYRRNYLKPINERKGEVDTITLSTSQPKCGACM